ncbi:MAG: hypothetical protein ACREBG_22555 [Pyrinomonadaceae bacterium]
MRIYAVYLPILRSDQESSVPSAMKRLSDLRVSFFWDGEGDLGQSYARVLKLPEGQPAWDVYFAFNRGVEWKNEPPAPDYWMHQLRGQPPDRLLDGEKFAAETNKLLQIKR